MYKADVMSDELELDLNLDEDINREKDRNKKLADKVRTTSEERDTLAKEKEEMSLAKANSDKERDFYKGFNQVSIKYPGANEYQDKILEKVNAGYDVEDATISILAKEGKYTPAQPSMERESAAGGSADIGIRGGNEKTPETMTQDERRKQLLELESKGEFHL